MVFSTMSEAGRVALSRSMSSKSFTRQPRTLWRRRRTRFETHNIKRRDYHTETAQRLSVKTNLKLAKLWLDRKEYDRLSKVEFPVLMG